jgi:hypothetical protein
MRKTNNINTNSILSCVKIKALIKQSLMRKKVKTLKKTIFWRISYAIFLKKSKKNTKMYIKKVSLLSN